jgi:hypothetical protein
MGNLPFVTVQGWRCLVDRYVGRGGHDNERPREADRRPRSAARRRAAGLGGGDSVELNTPAWLLAIAGRGAAGRRLAGGRGRRRELGRAGAPRHGRARPTPTSRRCSPRPAASTHRLEVAQLTVNSPAVAPGTSDSRTAARPGALGPILKTDRGADACVAAVAWARNRQQSLLLRWTPCPRPSLTVKTAPLEPAPRIGRQAHIHAVGRLGCDSR